jgi:hypothetical protein
MDDDDVLFKFRLRLFSLGGVGRCHLEPSDRAVSRAASELDVRTAYHPRIPAHKEVPSSGGSPWRFLPANEIGGHETALRRHVRSLSGNGLPDRQDRTALPLDDGRSDYSAGSA